MAATRGDMVVLVDVLSFSTTVATAVHHGAMIDPCADQTEAEAVARAVGGEMAVGRQRVPADGRYSLSPLTFLGVSPGLRVALNSLNGARCLRLSATAPHVLVAGLVNARAVARAVQQVLDTTHSAVTVVACGERVYPPTEDGVLRFAVEDYLGAGAVLHSIDALKTPDALVCEAAFTSARRNLPALLHACPSGEELVTLGFAGDVEHAAQMDVYDAVPVLRDGCLQPLAPRGDVREAQCTD